MLLQELKNNLIQNNVPIEIISVIIDEMKKEIFYVRV